MSQKKKTLLSPRAFSVRCEGNHINVLYKLKLVRQIDFDQQQIVNGKTGIDEWRIKTAKLIREAIDKGLLPDEIIAEAEKIEASGDYPLYWEDKNEDIFGDEIRPVGHVFDVDALNRFVDQVFTIPSRPFGDANYTIREEDE